MKKDASIQKIIADVLGLFNRREKTKFVFLYILGIGNALAEILSITAVLPFMYVILDIEKASQYPVLKDIRALPLIKSDAAFAVAAAIAVVLLFIVKSVYSSGYAFIKGSVMKKIQTKYALKLYEFYLNKPYEYFFSVNTSDLHRRVTSVSRWLIGSTVSSAMTLFTQCVTMLALIVTIIATGTSTILGASFLLVLICVVLYFATQKQAKKISKETNRLEKKLHRTVYEYLRGIKALRVLGRSGGTTGSVETLYDGVNRLEIKNNLILQIPGQVLEVGTVSVILYILVSSYISYGSINDVLPIISLCGAAIYKLRSELSAFLSTTVAIRNGIGYYEEVFDDLKAAAVYEKEKTNTDTVAFTDQIIADGISYTYPGTDKKVINMASVEIRRGESIGIMGPSGEGKSTLADILMGLLDPQNGSIKIDGIPLRGNEERFRRLVGYVPQTIFMMDASIMENVALGIPAEEIDREKVRSCLATAQLLEFVDSLPEKEDSLIGDSGIRISGGQRQRIGIARALYDNPQILLFDEATSSLDEETERNFVDTVNEMSGSYTIIMIAHRRETLKYCTRILRICNGKIEE